jgi:hypothetical protein
MEEADANSVNEQAKINDRGVAAVAYNVLLRPGVTIGLGGSFDTQKLDQATHKVRLVPSPWTSFYDAG